MARGTKRSGPERPQPGTHCAWGDRVFEAVRTLSRDAVAAALAQPRGADDAPLADLKWHPRHASSREQEDIKYEAKPVFHVLADAEAAAGPDAHAEDAIAAIAQELFEAGASPLASGFYKSGPAYAVDVDAPATARAILARARTHFPDEAVFPSVGAIGTYRQFGAYACGGSDIVNVAASKSTRLFDVVIEEAQRRMDLSQAKAGLDRVLSRAAVAGSGDIVSRLLAMGASPEGEGRGKSADWCDRGRPIHSAAAACSPQAMQALIDAGADVNTRQVNGFPVPGSAIHVLAMAANVQRDKSKADGCLECMRLLLAAGVDVNTASVMERKTPLQVALQGGVPIVVRFLVLEAGADVAAASRTADELRRKGGPKVRAVLSALETAAEDRTNGGAQRVQAAPQVRDSADAADFPPVGEGWTASDGSDLVDVEVMSDPEAGLARSAERMELAKACAAKTEVRDVALRLEAALNGVQLMSETDSSWRAVWMVEPAWSDGKPARGRGRAPTAQLCKATIAAALTGAAGIDAKPAIDFKRVNVRSVGRALDLVPDHDAVEAAVDILRQHGADASFAAVTWPRTVSAPVMVLGVIEADGGRHVFGVYATKVET